MVKAITLSVAGAAFESDCRGRRFGIFFCIVLAFFLILLLLEKPNVRKQIIVFTVKNNTEAKKGNSENVVCIFVTLAKEIAALSA